MRETSSIEQELELIQNIIDSSDSPLSKGEDPGAAFY